MSDTAFDEPDRGNIPERARAAVAEDDFITVGEIEEVMEAGTDAVHDPLDGGLAVGGACRIRPSGIDEPGRFVRCESWMVPTRIGRLEVSIPPAESGSCSWWLSSHAPSILRMLDKGIKNGEARRENPGEEHPDDKRRRKPISNRPPMRNTKEHRIPRIVAARPVCGRERRALAVVRRTGSVGIDHLGYCGCAMSRCQLRAAARN